MTHPYALSLPTDKDPVLGRSAALLQRIVTRRCGEPLPLGGAIPQLPRLDLVVDPALAAESYALRDAENGNLEVAGGSPRGLLYGIGRLLRGASYAPGVFTPGAWRGASAPAMPLRGSYWAVHFHNWYQDAPVGELEQYVEELALWGCNTFFVWLDTQYFSSFADPACQAMLSRLLAVLRAARRIGLATALLIIANEGYAAAPPELRAEWAVQNGYFHEPVGHFHTELCPSRPGGTELIMRELEEKLLAFREVGLDYLVIWPYDVGACTCKDCAPWGVRGYLSLAEREARLYRRLYSQGQVILSTWYFDHYVAGEWAGLAHAFRERPDWVDYLLADDYGDAYPSYPLEHGVPGGLPVIGFPEISMYASYPWSGYGANPLPAHLQAVWQPAKHLLRGGFPYSEGIYDDINKAVCAQFYWDPAQSTADTVRSYLAYEFGGQHAEKLSRAVAILEANHAHGLSETNEGFRFAMPRTEGAAKALELLRQVERQLSPERRGHWRWRQLVLRARIDAELAASQGAGTPASEAAFGELTALYHEELGEHYVAPPTRQAWERLHRNQVGA
ncbi:MAG: beta-N-acetylhexosaminidase family protein [Anaerolineae bacterium]